MARAIGAIGVRREYRRSELARPFLVARLAFTGRTSDPDLRREFARIIAERHLVARRSLYGERGQAAE
jgi:hypothetical protein